MAVYRFMYKKFSLVLLIVLLLPFALQAQEINTKKCSVLFTF
jgi:hypothetical protein